MGTGEEIAGKSEENSGGQLELTSFADVVAFLFSEEARYMTGGMLAYRDRFESALTIL